MYAAYAYAICIAQLKERSSTFDRNVPLSFKTYANFTGLIKVKVYA